MTRIFSARLVSLLGFVALATLAPQGTSAQTGGWVLLNAESTAMVRSGSDAMYNLRYSEADSIFNALIAKDPDHPAGYFLLALVDWWRIIPNIDVDSKVDRLSRSFNERIDKVIEISDRRLERNPSDIIGLFFKGSALGYSARLKVSRNVSSASNVLGLVEALNQGQEAYEIILRCQRLAPSNSDILLGSGLYNYLGAYIPEKLPALPATGLPPGDKKIGISMLRLSSQRAVYAGTEAKYSLLDILANMEKNYAEALPVARELYQQYPSNSVFHKFYARMLYQESDFAQADTLWYELLRRIQRREPGYEITLARQGLYFLGDCRLRSGNTEDAVKLFDQAIKQSDRLGDDESGWVLAAELRKGNALDILGRRDEAIRQYRRVLRMDDSNGSSHKKAEDYLKEPFK